MDVPVHHFAYVTSNTTGRLLMGAGIDILQYKLPENPIFVSYFVTPYIKSESIHVSARSMAWVCDGSLAGMLGSNPSGVMDDCLLCVVQVAVFSWG
jgi:hypothetical protein